MLIAYLVILLKMTKGRDNDIMYPIFTILLCYAITKNYY